MYNLNGKVFLLNLEWMIHTCRSGRRLLLVREEIHLASGGQQRRRLFAVENSTAAAGAGG